MLWVIIESRKGVANVREIAACREFQVPCSYPANNPTDIERLMGMGYTVFTMQRRNQGAFDAVETGRRRAGRPLVH